MELVPFIPLQLQSLQKILSDGVVKVKTSVAQDMGLHRILIQCDHGLVKIQHVRALIKDINIIHVFPYEGKQEVLCHVKTSYPIQKLLS